MSYSLHPEAEAEVARAANFYEERAGSALAKAFLDEFARVCDVLVKDPGLGRPATGELRVYSMRRFPYSLVYREDGSSILVLVVGHQHRRPDYWRGRV